MSNAAFTAIVYLEIVKKMAALVIELSKTSKVKRRFSALGLSPREWASTKVLWFSSKLYSLDEINDIHQSKDWNRVSQKDSRQPFNKVRMSTTVH
jgi:hypothetical protein